MRRVISSDFGEFGGTTVGHHVPRYHGLGINLHLCHLQEVVKLEKKWTMTFYFFPLSMVFVSGTSE